MELLNEFTGTVRKCVDDYDMIQAGDGIAVGVSGGKDSLVLLCALAHLRWYYPKPFRLEAVTLELGFPDMDFSPVAELCRRLEVPYTCKKTDIREIVFDIRREENPCSLCAKLRRGALNDTLKERGLNKLALGHHFDDAVQTFFLNLLYGGRIGCFSPKTYLSRKGITVIRPLIFCEEGRINGAVRRLELPVVKSACPADGVTARKDTADLIRGLEKQFPDLRQKVMGAMQRAGIDGW